MTAGGARRSAVSWAAFSLDLLPQSVRAFMSDVAAGATRTPIVVMGARYISAPNIEFSRSPAITHALPSEVASEAADSREIASQVLQVLEDDEGLCWFCRNGAKSLKLDRRRWSLTLQHRNWK